MILIKNEADRLSYNHIISQLDFTVCGELTGSCSTPPIKFRSISLQPIEAGSIFHTRRISFFVPSTKITLPLITSNPPSPPSSFTVLTMFAQVKESANVLWKMSKKTSSYKSWMELRVDQQQLRVSRASGLSYQSKSHREKSKLLKL
jgi:hypothetical protein